jgi:hypothetical protein
MVSFQVKVHVVLPVHRENVKVFPGVWAGERVA